MALIIEKPILGLLEIDRDTPLEITTDGDGLWIKPLRKRPAGVPKSFGAGKAEA